MKVLKAYGKNPVVYINGEKVSIDEVEGNTFFLDNIYNFGYGGSNQLVIVEDESEMDFFDGNGLINFEATRVPYRLYKALESLPGAAYLSHRDYDAETKTIEISCKIW